mgnify:FL=1
MTDEKEKKPVPEKPQDKSAEPSTHTWVDDMKQELEDYIEDQGIYIRQ